MPGVPHCRHQNRQGVHRSDAHPCRVAPNSGMDLPLDEESAIAAAGHGRAQSDDERRGSAGAHGLLDVAERRGQKGGSEEMRAQAALLLGLALLGTSCSRNRETAAAPLPAAFGVALIESSGGKQFAETGNPLPQPVVVQVNDENGTAVPKALVEFDAVPGVSFDPGSALTDDS